MTAKEIDIHHRTGNQMNTHDKYELPPLPASEEVTRQLENAFPWVEVHILMVDYARTAIEADRQRRGEPVAWPKTAAEIRDFIDVHYIGMAGADDPSDDDKYTLTAHDLLSAFRWWTGFAPQPAEPVKVVSDDEVLEAMRPSLDEGDGGYVCDMSPMHVIASGRALLARYGQPVEPEGWQLVPKEPTKEMLINAMEASLLGRPSPDDDSYVRSIVSAWCEAAPKFGEEE